MSEMTTKFNDKLFPTYKNQFGFACCVFQDTIHRQVTLEAYDDTWLALESQLVDTLIDILHPINHGGFLNDYPKRVVA